MGPGEFYPLGTTDRSEFCVEISPSWSSDGSYDVTLWSGSSGANLGIPIRDITKARRIARFFYATYKPEAEAEEERRSRQNAEFNERMKVEWAERDAREKREREERLAKITPETERIELAVCPSCQQTANPEEFHQPVYECSRCGQTQVGEENRRCETDHIFMARVGDFACPSCEDALDEEPELVLGVEIDGVFIPEAEIAA